MFQVTTSYQLSWFNLKSSNIWWCMTKLRSVSVVGWHTIICIYIEISHKVDLRAKLLKWVTDSIWNQINHRFILKFGILCSTTERSFQRIGNIANFQLPIQSDKDGKKLEIELSVDILLYWRELLDGRYQDGDSNHAYCEYNQTCIQLYTWLGRIGGQNRHNIRG